MLIAQVVFQSECCVSSSQVFRVEWRGPGRCRSGVINTTGNHNHGYLITKNIHSALMEWILNLNSILKFNIQELAFVNVLNYSIAKANYWRKEISFVIQSNVGRSSQCGPVVTPVVCLTMSKPAMISGKSLCNFMALSTTSVIMEVFSPLKQTGTY